MGIPKAAAQPSCLEFLTLNYDCTCRLNTQRVHLRRKTGASCDMRVTCASQSEWFARLLLQAIYFFPFGLLPARFYNSVRHLEYCSAIGDD